MYSKRVIVGNYEHATRINNKDKKIERNMRILMINKIYTKHVINDIIVLRWH